MRFSNTYIFIYASVMVIIVAAVLSFTAIKLKPKQDQNIEIEKKQNILESVNITSTVEDAEELFNKFITDSYIINSFGQKKKGDAFNVRLEIELKKLVEERDLPLFVCTQNDGTKNLIIPVRGKGLWGPIWGYVALKDDYNTIKGVTFGHKSETPGLGSEIDTKLFQSQFKSKKIFDSYGSFKSIKVVKGGAQPDNIHGVDAISGGTITSDALQEMLHDCLSSYETYLKNQK